jgi:release factor glutamine methyltransferase
MNVNDAYKNGINKLKNAGNEAPANDAGALLCFVAGCDRTFLFAHGTEALDDTCLAGYLALLERRAAGEPLQYLTGRQEFMSLSFRVGPGVLVPRQDTELLVETVINLCRERKEMTELLDIGTGSGCIAVSLAHYIPGCSVVAVDKMPDALAIAGKNALENGVAGRIEFIRSDLFEAITDRQFDIIVSNPPYIRTEDIDRLQKEVRCHEPMTALDGGIDGLDFYREIIGTAPGFLRNRGFLVFETGYDQAAKVAVLMADRFRRISIHKDLAGIERVVAGICR